MITAPYNFVPLNKEVFYPEQKEINHDVPYQDSISGAIDITITAQSPIFIRNHYTEGDEYYTDEKGNRISKEFCSIKLQDGSRQYYIPGSSLKGMIRNVMEILSFAKITVDENNLSKPLSIRDMTNRKELLGTAQGCGFLVYENGSYYIEDCGKPLTISYHEVKKATGLFPKNISSAKEKYQKINNKTIKINKKNKTMNVRGRTIPKKVAEYNPNSNITGTLVFTGAINNKKNEFVFVKNNQKIKVSNEIIEDFKKVYFSDSSNDYYFWKKDFDNKQAIPIFYSKNNDKITAIGFTQLFKLAYKKTLLEASKQNIDRDKLDLPERIFGFVSNSDALKGRVIFSHCKSNIVRFEKEKKEILGTPQPTYYPNYIRQDCKNGTVSRYKTLMDKDATIAGYKRYPLHQNIKKSHITNDNEKVTTTFKPLDKGTIFKGKIIFHNLQKYELGALLSAITFHNNQDALHNIGMAKALGYGKIKIEIEGIDNIQTYIELFEKEISKKIQNWKNSSQLKELIAMANDKASNDSNLIYQLLENPKPKYGRDKNDFTGAKKAKECLKPYSEQIKNKIVDKKVTTSVEKQTTQSNQNNQASTAISKTKMKKAITNYWSKKFNIFYHPNQIKEFFSEDGFKTTPKEQAKVYIENKDNENFVKLLQEIKKFIDNKSNEKELLSLYNKLLED